MIYHILGHKISLSKFNKIEFISSTFSDQSGLQLAIRYRKKTQNEHNYVETKQHTAKHPWTKKEIKSTLRKMKTKHNFSKGMGWSKHISKRKSS